MFKTEMEFIENGYLVSAWYGGLFKRWHHVFFEDALVHRSVLEHHYWEQQYETLKEKMS